MSDSENSSFAPISDEEDLIRLNREGIIAGPGELKFSFLKRVDEMLENAPDHPASFPARLRSLFDINPEHIEVLYTNEGMDVWEAGCTWILQNKVTIQLRKQLHKAVRWCGIYSKEEILAHEAVHAARMKFYEPMFEEVLAYQTSSRLFRRILGPLLRSQGEWFGFLFFIFLGLLITLWQPLLGIGCMAIAPTYFGVRLAIVHSYFRRAKKKIRKMLGIEPLWVLLRLSDAEIRMFASEPIPVLERYARERKLDSIRWQQIYLSYFV